MSRMTVISDPSADYHAKVEQFSEHLIIKGDIHAHIHAGAFFSTGLRDVALLTATSLEILVTTPAASAGFIHLRGSASCGGDATISFFEAPTVTVVGTALTPVNRSRSSANTDGATWTHTPTTTADGTTLFAGYVPGGSGGTATGGSIQSFEEWILAPETTYLIRLTNVSGQTQIATVSIDFYDSSHTQ